MNRVLVFCTFLLCLLQGSGWGRVIYGEDHRRDIYEVKNALWRQWARATTGMIASWRLSYQSAKKVYHLSHDRLEDMNYCPSERFFEQPVAAECSGLWMGGDILLTAGHCVKSDFDCENYSWVFDFNVQREGQVDWDIAEDNVYRCVEVLERKFDVKNDYSVLRLDRVVKGRKPLGFRRKGKVAKGQKVVIIGHSLGLPSKVGG